MGVWSPAVNNTATTTYTFTPNQSGCAAPTTMEIVVIPNVIVSISGKTGVCQGGSFPDIVLSATNGTAPYTYTYSIGNGETKVITTNDNSIAIDLASFDSNNVGCHDIAVEVSANGGCVSNAVFTDHLCVYANPNADFRLNSGGQLGDVITVNESIGATSYEWNFGDGSGTYYSENPIHSFSDESTETYTVQLIASNANGCRDTTYRTIKIEEELVFYVPNTFTPDGDEYNNVFKPVISSGYDLTEYSLDIYNRWGERIFTSLNSEIGWDGTYNGSLTQDGTYTWKISLKIIGIDDRKEYVGHVNIVR
jgi:gliding motility-associated-like protein